MNTETLNPNNTYGVYVSMLMLFRSSDLQTLLGSFNFDVSGSKVELQNRAIVLLKNTPRTFYHKYSLKIIDMFKYLYCFMGNDVTQNETQYQNQQQLLSVVQAQHLMPVNIQAQQQQRPQQQRPQQQRTQQRPQQRRPRQRLQQQQLPPPPPPPPPPQQQQPPPPPPPPQQQPPPPPPPPPQQQPLPPPPPPPLQLQQQMLMNMQDQQQMSGSLWNSPQSMALSQQALFQESKYGYSVALNNNFQSANSYNMNYYQSMHGKYENTVSHNQQLNLLTPSNHTVTTDDNVQHSVTNFTFKETPFYDIIDEIIKPTILTIQDASVFLKTIISKDLKSNVFKFKLSSEQFSNITMSTTLLNGNIGHNYQLQMRIGRLQANSTEISDSLPTRFFIQTNDNINRLPGFVLQKSNPINCTQLFKFDVNAVNEMAIFWDQDGNIYVMGMYLVRKLSSDILLNKLYTKKSKSVQDTLNVIINRTKNFDPDIHTTTLYRFSLICPLSKTRIKVPVNSIICNHLQCFDANTFILMNEKTPTWKCPCCNIPCLYDDLQINFYFLNVLTNPYLPDFVEEIELLPDGTWKEFNTKKTNNIEDVSGTNQIPFVDNRPSDDIIDLTQDNETNVNQSIQYY